MRRLAALVLMFAILSAAIAIRLFVPIPNGDDIQDDVATASPNQITMPVMP